MSIATTVSLLRTAIKQLPALRYTWGLVALSAAASIATKLNGDGKAAVIAGSVALIGFILVVIASATTKAGPWIQLPAKVLTWSIIGFFLVFLGFTISAYAASWPCNWVSFLGISSSGCGEFDKRSEDHPSDYLAVEEQLRLAFFQFFEARYLGNARTILASLDPATSDRNRLDRLRLIEQILKLSLIGLNTADQAAILLSRFTSKYPNDPWLPLLKASTLYSSKSYLACADTLVADSAKYIYPEKSAAEFFTGVCYLRAARDTKLSEHKQDLSQKALNHFRLAQTVLSASPADYYQRTALASSIHFQGITQYYRKDIGGALQLFEQAAAIAEGGMKARALNGAGFIYLSQGNLAKAELALTDAMDHDPSFPYAKSNYGYVLLAKADLVTARKVFSENSNDERLKSESYRDVVLANLALVHIDELAGKDVEGIIKSYEPILADKGIQNFSGVTPAAFRLANIHRAIAKAIYLDKDYYGLEIFALALLTKAYLETNSQPHHDERMTAFLRTVSKEIADTQGAVSQDWLSGNKTGWFESLSQYQQALTEPHRATSKIAPQKELQAASQL